MVRIMCKKMLMRKSYAKNPEAKNKTSQMWYRKHRYLVLYRQRIRYYGSTMHMRTTKLMHHAFHCTTQKLQNNQLCKQIKLNMTIKKACSSLCEPKLDVKEAYVRKNIKIVLHCTSRKKDKQKMYTSSSSSLPLRTHTHINTPTHTYTHSHTTLLCYKGGDVGVYMYVSLSLTLYSKFNYTVILA